MSSLPFAGPIISSAGMRIPGFPMSVPNPNQPPVGPGRLKPPGVSFGPGNRFMPPMKRDGDGLPRGKKNNVELQSNTNIVNPITVKLGPEKNELHIIEGMPVFLATGTTPLKINNLHITMYTPVFLGQLNMYLQRAWQSIQTEIGRNNPKAIQYRDLMKLVSEDSLNHYISLNSPGAEVTPKDLFLDEAANAHVVQLFQLCKAIFHFFNFAGVLINTSRNTTFDSYASTSNNSLILSFNISETGITEMHDIFTPTAEMQVGAKLWFHYKRRKLENGQYGSFVIEPVCSIMNEHPHTTGSYRDASGTSCSGILQEIGTVVYNKDRDDSTGTLRKASGVDPSGDLEQMKRATANTGKITVDLQHLRH